MITYICPKCPAEVCSHVISRTLNADAENARLRAALLESQSRIGVDGLSCWCMAGLPDDWHTQRCHRLRAALAGSEQQQAREG